MVSQTRTRFFVARFARCSLIVGSPDKNPGVKDIQERFARMGVIAQILRSPESRERYNVSGSDDLVTATPVSLCPDSAACLLLVLCALLFAILVLRSLVKLS